MRRIYVGAALVVAGIAAQIVAHSDAPGESCLQGSIVSECKATGLSKTAYDLLRIGAWALIVFGLVTLIAGFIAFRAKSRT